MKIGKPFNQLDTVDAYCFYIDRHEKYTDFNTLGLYRSLRENTLLSPEDKITVREYAHRLFRKAFEFLQLKDPDTYIAVNTLGQELTKADEAQLWEDVKKYQQQTLQSKRIRHRSFGVYSKHNCGHEDCVYNGVMIHQGSTLQWANMHFTGDTGKSCAKVAKSIQSKRDRKTAQRIIRNEQADD